MRNIHTTVEPVTLEGFQAILKPGKFGNYKLSALVDQEMIDKLEVEREEALNWARSKLANPKRSVLKPTPWEEVADGKYLLKFTWNEDKRPPIVDTEGVLLKDLNTPIYSGAQVKLGFTQKPYILKDKVSYGTSLKLSGVQIVSISTTAGVDAGDLNEDEAAELFGKCKGFKAGDPNVVTTEPESNVDDDF